MEIPAEAIRYSIMVFGVATMFAMGLGVTIEQIGAPLTNRKAVARALLANVILVPALAWVIVKLSSIAGSPLVMAPLATAFLLLAMAPGMLLVPELAKLSKSNVPFAVGMMVILVVVSVVTIPVTALLLLPPEAGIDFAAFGAIAGLIGLYLLLPLGLGLSIKARYALIADSIRPPVVQIATLAFVLLAALLVVDSVDLVREQPASTETAAASEVTTSDEEETSTVAAISTATAAMLIVVGGALAFGYYMGYAAANSQKALATTTAVRNIVAALIILSEHFTNWQEPDLSPFAFVLVFFVAGTVIAAITAGEWGRKGEEDPEPASAGAEEAVEAVSTEGVS